MPKKIPVLYSHKLVTPTFWYFYTDISAISVTFCNSATEPFAWITLTHECTNFFKFYKVLQISVRPNMCYIFLMQGVQGYQIWHSPKGHEGPEGHEDICLFLNISLTFSTFLYISLTFSTFPCISLLFLHSRHFSEFLQISLCTLHSKFQISNLRTIWRSVPWAYLWAPFYY